MQAAPETGHHTVSDALREEALAAFFPVKCECTPTTGGVNNVCQYVDTEDGKKYILRVYNNGGQSKKVVFEHEVLRQLGGRKGMSFQVPRAVPSLKDGQSHVKLSRWGAVWLWSVGCWPAGLSASSSTASGF
jgi:homoserine kinase type II